MPGDLPYSPTPFTVTFLGGTTTLVRPRNPDEVLESISDEDFSRDSFLPYWAEQWPSSNFLLSFLEEEGLPFGSRICELGSGLGIIASALTCRSPFVVATDISFDSCRYADWNMQRAWRELSLKKYWAPTETDSAGISGSGHLPLRGALCCDWRFPPFKEKFDVIVASDVLYEKRWIEPVISFLGETLKPGAVAFFADPCRSHWQPFLSECRSRGFHVEIVFRQKAVDPPVTIEIARLTLAN